MNFNLTQQNVWVTSDLHFYHKNIMKFNPSTRPYESVTELNNAMFADWKGKVFPNDIIIHFGDFSFGSVEQTVDVLQRLPGKKIFIRGNHDQSLERALKIVEPENKIVDYIEARVRLNDHTKPTPVMMFHYPIESWNKQHHGSVMLHGHCHNSLPPWGRRRDVGWDAYGEIIPLQRAVEDSLECQIVTAEGDHHTERNDNRKNG